ncbi:MAG TPA: hypothetical protein VN661_11460 [Candidatus Acidoferrales bacterium]|nr:hypothetical protein [Candidatus Acidoferrales bacterium]
MKADPASGVLDSGFRDLYELKFQGARTDFASYQKLHPNDPLGKAAEAASYLYEQFSEKGVLTSNFFLDDSKLLGGVEGDAAENRNSAFLKANHETRHIAEQHLKTDPQDADSLLALTMADGMESDYDALIEKKQLASISFMRKAESDAKNLLAVDPSADDAYVALGASNYIIGCMPVYKRAFLWFGGMHGDRARGMKQLASAANHGRYLKPFAKILLALAAEREHETSLARGLLSELAHQFPENPLFAHELALLEERVTGKKCNDC